MPFLLPDIADNASGGAGSLESTSSSASSGSAGETDSLGGGGGHRNSSPENAMAVVASNPAASNKLLKKMEVEDPRLGRLSPMVLSRPSHLRLKQQLLAAGKLRKSSNALSTGDLGYHTMNVNGSSGSGTGGSSSNNSTMETVSVVVGQLLKIGNW